jgi:hypothetical protein
MDVSPDHEPTLIERGTNIHLNRPLTARRGIHDSRPARWESWTPHPSALRKGGEGAYGQAGELDLIALSGPRLGAQRTATPPGYAPNVGKCRYVRMAPPRPAETNTSHTGSTLWKNLAGVCTLLQGFGGYTRGCTSASPWNGTTIKKEESPIRKHQPLRVPNGYRRKGSGATVGDGHKGPLNNRGKHPFPKIIN